MASEVLSISTDGGFVIGVIEVKTREGGNVRNIKEALWNPDFDTRAFQCIIFFLNSLKVSRFNIMKLLEKESISFPIPLR